MPRGRAYFSSEELVRVLSHYDIGVIEQVKSLSGGNRLAPKTVLISEKGKFLLKRRQKGSNDLCRVSFAHAVQSHLGQKGFPATSLIATRDQNNTILQLDNHVYELFRFVTGVRYDGSPEATLDVGRQLAEFHHDMADFVHDRQVLISSFHDSSMVRRHLKALGDGRTRSTSRGSDLERPICDYEQQTTKALLALYNESSIRVNRLGFGQWEQQVVHGDWHPGNMLFSNHKLIAVLDFDSVKVAPTVTDLANGMLQFSIIAGRPSAADWPDHCDELKLAGFLKGYRQVIEPDGRKVESLVDMMVETMIAEAVLPVAATGFFGHHSGPDFLKMILRKSEWLAKNRLLLTELLAV